MGRVKELLLSEDRDKYIKELNCKKYPKEKENKDNSKKKT